MNIQDDLNWVELAKSIPVGKTIKIPHCSHSAKCYVTHQPNGYKRHCFRCGLDEFKSKGKLSIKEAQDTVRYLFSVVNKYGYLELPEDYTTDVPSEYSVWYTRFGISPDTAARYGIGWSDTLQRIVLPVYDYNTGEIEAIQARAVKEGQQPKYLNPNGPRTSESVFFAGFGSFCNSLCVTEDILSAIKISESGVPACSIMGTAASDGKAFKIAKYAKENFLIPCVWLDPDQAGAAGTLKVIKKLALYTDNIRVIRSDKDPKYYSREEIQAYTQGAIDA